MKTRPFALVLAVALSLCSSPSDVRAESSGLSEPQLQRPILVTQAGPQVLSIDLELLAGAMPSLADLRLYDEAGREVAYLVVPPRLPEPTWRDAATIRPTVARQGESGFDADLGASVNLDRVRVSGLAAPFMKRLRLEGSADHIHYTLLVADATLFDLPADGLRRLELELLPGEFRFLRLVWDDRNSTALGQPESVSVRLAQGRDAAPPLRAAVPFELREARPPLGQWRIRLPARGLPITAVEVETKQPQLHREARVSESRLEVGRLESRALGAAMLRRAQRSGLVATDLRIPIQRPEGNDLVLSVDNGNNPPLVVDQVTVELAAQPTLYFEAKSVGRFVMRYGRKTAEAPRYDLEVERERIALRQPALAAWAGPAAPLPLTAPTPSASTAGKDWSHGRVLDRGQFQYSRAIVGGTDGMVSVRLDAAVLAHSRDLGDLRILDAASRQVPYLMEHESEPLILDLTAQPTTTETRPTALDVRYSAYRVPLPYPGLPAARLVLTTGRRVFRREVAVYVEDTPRADSKRRADNTPRLIEIARATWTHGDPDQAAAALELALSAGAARELVLAVEEGDNDRLPLEACRLRLAAHGLRFFRQPGDSLTLLYGAPNLTAPAYDLALLADELKTLATHEASLDAELAKAPTPAKPNQLSRWFWGVLIVTVLSLVAFIARLVRKGPPLA